MTNFYGGMRYSNTALLQILAPAHLPPTSGRVYDHTARRRRQRCRALSVPNRHLDQVGGPIEGDGRKDGVLVSFCACFRRLGLSSSSSVAPPLFHPEYGRYMLESTPGAPYTGCVRDLVLVEPNMRLRWASINSLRFRWQKADDLAARPHKAAHGALKIEA